mmetsp:Transcript_8587/g.12686  ORF Transcript_8587/g.12686 Transcript_8587/m.12686 type:complete len:88 (+) Transcript_8587:200-463(+)
MLNPQSNSSALFHARNFCDVKKSDDFEFGVHVLLTCLILTISYMLIGCTILSSMEKQDDAYFLEELYFFCQDKLNVTSVGGICANIR